MSWWRLRRALQGLACRDRCVWHLLTHPTSLGWLSWGYGEFLQQNKSQELAVGTCDEQATVNTGEICGGAGGRSICGIYPSGGYSALLGAHQGKYPTPFLCWHGFVASREARWQLPRPHLQSTAYASICERGLWLLAGW